MNLKPPHLSFLSGRGDLEEEVPVGGVGGVVSQLSQDVGPRRGSDVHIMREGCAICRGTGKWVLLRGLF